MEITIDFNWILVIFIVWLLINWLVNVAGTFTDILKHYFLKMNAFTFGKCILKRTTLNYQHPKSKARDQIK